MKEPAIWLSPAAFRTLRAVKHIPLSEGRIELSMETGLQGLALELVIQSLQRKGLVGADGYVTAKGEALLRPPPPPPATGQRAATGGDPPPIHPIPPQPANP